MGQSDNSSSFQLSASWYPVADALCGAGSQSFALQSASDTTKYLSISTTGAATIASPSLTASSYSSFCFNLTLPTGVTVIDSVGSLSASSVVTDSRPLLSDFQSLLQNRAAVQFWVPGSSLSLQYSETCCSVATNNIPTLTIFANPVSEWQWYISQYNVSTFSLGAYYISIRPVLNTAAYLVWNGSSVAISASSSSISNFNQSASWRPVADSICGSGSGLVAFQWAGDITKFLMYSTTTYQLTVSVPPVSVGGAGVSPFCFNATLINGVPLTSILNYSVSLASAPAVVTYNRPNLTDIVNSGVSSGGVLLFISQSSMATLTTSHLTA